MDTTTKMWGRNPYWGLNFDNDPQWCLTDEHKKLQRELIELCRTRIRPNAVHTDATHEYPRKSLNALAEHGFLGMIVPKDMGGLGLDHVGICMVIETVARYGCPSTAMVLVMHTGAVGTLLLRGHSNPLLEDIARRINSDKLVGTFMYSDPATGGHFWFPLSSKVKEIAKETHQILKVSSWTTSAGFADFYVMQTVSPGYDGDYSDSTCWLVYKDEIRANSDDWRAIGMRGNQSGAITFEGTLTADRLVGSVGSGRYVTDEIAIPYFLMTASACWCGLAFAMIDLAKKHVTSKYHADVGLRVCDYPTIQDYFGESISFANACRSLLYTLASGMDKATNHNDWKIHADPNICLRFPFMNFANQTKFMSSRMVEEVSTTMLHACGGSGFKEDLGIERLIRDSLAAWVMGPSNEFTRQCVGINALLGVASLDLWAQHVNKRQIEMGTKRLSTEDKETLAKQLLRDVEIEKSSYDGENKYQGSEFDNPHNTEPPRSEPVVRTQDGTTHAPGLNVDGFVALELKSIKRLTDKVSEFAFALTNKSDHLGCMPGQYLQIRVQTNGKKSVRYYSPTSSPNKYGVVELVARLERQGLVSQHLRSLKPGDLVEFRGPCGGYEYAPNKLDHITFISNGVGCTPALQMVRSIMDDPTDKVKVTMVHSAENPEDIFFREEFENYASRDERFNVSFLVRQADHMWEGREGFIDDQALKDSMPSASLSTKHKIILCGGSLMVVTVLQYLKELGYTSDQIFIYGPFGVDQLRNVYGRKAKLCTHKAD